MKNTILFIAVATFGFVWIGEKLSADRMSAELTRLRQQRDEFSNLLRERDRLRHRLDNAGGLEKTLQEQTAPANPMSAAKLEPGLPPTMPLGDWVTVRAWGFRGQITPQASVESALWAAAGGDVATLKQLLFVSEETRAAAAGLLASLPASSRMAYPTPDDLISVLTIKRIPLGEAQLVWLDQNGPDTATACVFLKDPVDPTIAREPEPEPRETRQSPPQLPADKKTIIAYLALKRDGINWRLVVPTTAVETMARELGRTAKSGS